MTCGGQPATPNPALAGTGEQAKRIATFYFDISQFKWDGSGFAIPFTIALVSPKYPETRIILDPKIRDNGGGLHPLGGNGHNN
jgi:hypothetical protein